MSTPASRACTASWGAVTVCTTTEPALRSAAITPSDGMPKVNDTIGTGLSSSSAIFSSNLSVSSTGPGGSVTPNWSASR